MSENDHSQLVSTVFHHDGSIPAARAIGDFAWERVGDDLVLFDAETMQYHTLNAVAERIWRSCNGIANVEAIAASTGLPVETIETTVGELGEASLLSTPAETWSIPMTRRRAARLIAAGVAGAIGVPVVLSLTAPSHQAAASGNCSDSLYNTVCESVGDWCISQSYGTLYCCHQPGGSTLWYDPNQACQYGWDCGPGCPQGSTGSFAVVDDAPYVDDSVYDAMFADDPYLKVDEDGNVDLDAIRAQQSAASENSGAAAPHGDEDGEAENADGTDDDDRGGGDAPGLVQTSSDEGESATAETDG